MLGLSLDPLSPLPLPVGVHEHIHFDWAGREHCRQNPPAEYHFYKVILDPAGHDEGPRDSGVTRKAHARARPDGGEQGLHAAHAPPHYEQSALRNEFYLSHLEVAASTLVGSSSVILKYKMCLILISILLGL